MHLVIAGERCIVPEHSASSLQFPFASFLIKTRNFSGFMASSNEIYT